MNYEKMSDLQLNKAVTCELFNCYQWSVNESGNFYHCGSDDSAYYEVRVIDYCNNPSDAWPIIMENGISLLDPELCGAIPEWCATKFTPRYGVKNIEIYHKNPLRAAMIVFLMIQEAKRG